MDKKICSGGGVTLVGGGPCESADIDAALVRAPYLVAADGGADWVRAAGRQPELVLGDMDSISDLARAELPPEALVHIPDQDTTDFEKCLQRISAPLILAVGFLGGRFDHSLAACTTLSRFDGRCILLGREDIVFAVPASLELDLAPGTRVSLYPMARVGGRSEGLEWPIDGLTLEPAGRIGTSNRATGPVRLDFHAPGMLVIVPRGALDRVIAATA
ncbi:thiamine diphosphokinase [Maribius pontilimi]|uniref:Thiamine diphosphokinase n=1 Tax=Palleronia pontilimi TaxID=1964209 RepID=A0A934ICX3_9RHOB|nr:thiamine diphosphokinase [Palleronia pontilimi]MBJ3761215.1 thiamine diphosphokinase [Palleronia pontilimi]